ncbi:hypothetical protein [uncultured Lacinutrix sp.]|uniref:hypothetical protein n=1 Tax=uncultured Lacinutrix sp. TaxID=574032 RepID=UPI0026373712|nr:hypothetical protein [uncultured Lacinutrix sp.]
MKKLFLVLIVLNYTITSKAQDASVEKSIYGIQTGLLGVWVHNEYKLSNAFALRSELGIDAGVSITRDNTDFLAAPVITLEPRWYYNLNKRVKKSRRIDGNSGNFISIKTSYHPDALLTSVRDNVNFLSDITIVPTWGIRRNIGKHFNYETGIGVGYIKIFKEANTTVSSQDVAVNLHLRIGYRF